MEPVDPARVARLAFLPPAPGARAGGLEIARAEGAYLFTPDGRRILDAAGGAIVANVGHGRPEVAEAVARALREISYVVPPFLTEGRARLVERLQERWLPEGVGRVMLTSGGSESVDSAIRLARQHFVARSEPTRWKVIGRELSYHGITLATLAAGDHPRRRAGLEPLLLPFPKAPACHPLRCARCKGACDLSCADALEALILREGPETVAAFLAEPIGGSTSGALVPPEGYWPRVVEICRRHGVLVIADEVMCGFGRTGKRFAVEHFGVVPDILVGGKGLAGGYAAIGGVFAREEVVAPIAEAGHEVMFFTFSAHPAACAAADAVLGILEREKLVARAAEMGARLRQRLEARFAEHPHVAEIRGRGLLLALELVRDRETLEPFPSETRLTARVLVAGLARGVFFYPGGAGASRDVICLGPPFVIDDDDVELLVESLAGALDDAVGRVLAGA
jgi:adenosylmethionine-8-amino-7-oxononanoate aminotransferase